MMFGNCFAFQCSWKDKQLIFFGLGVGRGVFGGFFNFLIQALMDALEPAQESFLTPSLCDGLGFAAQIGGHHMGRVGNTSMSEAQEARSGCAEQWHVAHLPLPGVAVSAWALDAL